MFVIVSEGSFWFYTVVMVLEMKRSERLRPLGREAMSHTMMVQDH